MDDSSQTKPKRRKSKGKPSSSHTPMDVDSVQDAAGNADMPMTTANAKGKGRKDSIEDDEDDEGDKETAITTKTSSKPKKRRHKKSKRNDFDSGVGLEISAQSDQVNKEDGIRIPLPPEDPIPESVPSTNAKKEKKKRRKKTKVIDGGDEENGPSSGHESKSTAPGSWDCLTLADPSLQSHPAMFSKDGRYYFLPKSSRIEIHSLSTLALLSTIALPRKDNKLKNTRITSLIIHPSNEFQLLAGCTDGKIRIWDWLDGVLLRTINVGKSVVSMCAIDDDRVVIAQVREKHLNAGQSNNTHTTTLSLVTLRKDAKSSTSSTTSASSTKGLASSSPTVLFATAHFASMAPSPDHKWLVVLAKEEVNLVPIPTGAADRNSITEDGKTLKFKNPHPLTGAIWHPDPTQSYFATSDSKGQIRIWHLSTLTSSSHRNPSSAIQAMHWHAHPLPSNSLSFTPNGSHIVSGGEEGVLVIWDLDSGGFRREFVPRLGGAIDWVRCFVAGGNGGGDGLEYMVGMRDGGVLVIDAKERNVRFVGGGIRHLDSVLYTPPPSHPPVRLPLAYSSDGTFLVFPSSHPSSLQTFNPFTQTRSEIEISPSNRVSRRDPTSNAWDHDIARVTFVRVIGNWMVTADERLKKGEVTLKFWEKEGSTGWSLNTRVDRPHGVGKVITDIQLRPRTLDDSSDTIATAGSDGFVRFWRTKVSKGAEYWHVVEPHETRSKTPSRLAFSRDGSLMAVAQGAFVTLHTFLTGRVGDVVHTISCAEMKDVLHLSFVGSRGRYLVMGGLKDVVVWDLIVSSVQWRYSFTSLKISHIVAHPVNETLLVFLQPKYDNEPPITSVLLFDAASYGSVPTSTKTLPFRLKEVEWCRPDDSLSHSLVAITDKLSIILCGDDLSFFANDVRDGSTVQNRLGVEAPRRPTLFEDLFGKSVFVDPASQKSAIEQRKPAVEERISQTALLSLFDGPSQTLPPIESLYAKAMETLLPRRPDEGIEVERQPEIEETDVPMEDVEDLSPVQHREVPQEELEELTKLFESFPATPSGPQMSSPSTPTSQAPAALPNGVATTNGVHNPQPANGMLHPRLRGKASRAAIVKPVTPTPTETTPSSSPPPATGSKRKKM